MTTSIKEILKARYVINEDLRKISSEDWFRSQPANIKANTIASQLLHQAIIAKNPNEISDALIKCIEQKVSHLIDTLVVVQLSSNLQSTLLKVRSEQQESYHSD